MSRSFFHPENALWITVGQITDVIFLSLFWLLGCIPVVTIGPACAALYDSVWRTFRKKERDPWRRFFHSLKRNFKTGVFASVIWVLLAAGLGWGMIQVWNAAVYGQIGWAGFAAAAFAAFVLAGFLALVFPLLSRFETGVGQLFGNAFRLAMGNLPRTLGLAAVNVLGLFLCLRFVWPMFVLPALMALASTLFVEPVLKPFMPENP